MDQQNKKALKQNKQKSNEHTIVFILYFSAIQLGVGPVQRECN